MKIIIELECEVDGEYAGAAHEELLSEAVALSVPPAFPLEADVCIVVVRRIAVEITDETP